MSPITACKTALPTSTLPEQQVGTIFRDDDDDDDDGVHHGVSNLEPQVTPHSTLWDQSPKLVPPPNTCTYLVVQSGPPRNHDVISSTLTKTSTTIQLMY